MKGIIFTSFIELVEEAFGLEVMDRVLEKADPPSGGIYTAVGTYPHTEIVSLVVALSEETGVSIPDLLHTYGKHLYGILAGNYPDIVAQYGDGFDLLEHIEDHIHTQVRKLYPDASLPMFYINNKTDSSIDMRYESERSLSDVAHGLIDSCFKSFQTPVKIEKELLTENGSEALFKISKLSTSE